MDFFPETKCLITNFLSRHLLLSEIHTCDQILTPIYTVTQHEFNPLKNKADIMLYEDFKQLYNKVNFLFVKNNIKIQIVDEVIKIRCY